MTTHYHLLLETTQGGLSQGMHFLNGAYARHFNARHNRRGHVFEGRFNAFLVEGDRYLERASRYILENPVRAGICDTAEEWPWNGGLIHLETLMRRTGAKVRPVVPA